MIYVYDFGYDFGSGSCFCQLEISVYDSALDFNLGEDIESRNCALGSLHTAALSVLYLTPKPLRTSGFLYTL